MIRAAVVILVLMGAMAQAQPVSEETREFERERYEEQRDERHGAEEDARELRRRREAIYRSGRYSERLAAGESREEIIQSIDPDAPLEWEAVDAPSRHMFFLLVGLAALALASAGLVLYARRRSRGALATDGAFESVDTRTGDALGAGLADVSTIVVALDRSARGAFASIEGDAFDRLRGTVRALLASKSAWLAAGTIDADPSPVPRASAQLRKAAADVRERVASAPADERGVLLVAISVAGSRDLGGFSTPRHGELLEKRMRHLAGLLPDELVGVEVSVLPHEGSVELAEVQSLLALSTVDEGTLPRRLFCESCASPFEPAQQCPYCGMARRIAPV